MLLLAIGILLWITNKNYLYFYVTLNIAHHLKKILYFFYVVNILFPLFSVGQQNNSYLKVETMASLKQYGDSILKAKSDSSRQAHHQLFKFQLDSILRLPQSFNQSFDSIKNLSVLTSNDNKLRIYTWMLPEINGMNYYFFGYLQVLNAQKKMKVYELKEIKYGKNDDAEFLKLNDTTWYGALYYKLLHKQFDKKDQYILLGWQGKDIFSTRKVMDCLTVSPTKIEFGKQVFKSTGKAKSRIILEYNAQAGVSFNYNDQMDMIIQDHLSPSDPRPEAKGMFSLYGPDLSYDGWKFKEGIWYLQKNIVVKNKKDKSSQDIKLRHDFRMQRKEE